VQKDVVFGHMRGTAAAFPQDYTNVKTMTTESTRREFARFAVGTMTALGASRVMGANDRIRMGLIGCGNRGSQIWSIFLKQPEVEPVAVCDVYTPYRDTWKQKSGPNVRAYKDFRELLAQRGIDAGFLRNAIPGFKPRELTGELPPTLDWDMWLGPAPSRPAPPLRPFPLPLQLPLVLGLQRRADDQLWRARSRYLPLDGWRARHRKSRVWAAAGCCATAAKPRISKTCCTASTRSWSPGPRAN
jgi:hypothetical protein